ncbi:bifunctional folylpolyglutamate synthase/dihydrofolate synthase [Bacillus canaveralius]|uniref:Dihydrofolate synthase/folylpolyglutamate synthase n=1 Tax=Bacillus canaveralius TaxID=1403243 RepID=A0A2N5GQ43_9BACI|nr:folylpolyglutamate synthase/dihydrofolate synthase family protein [Bacillus canaveralius]PLR84993.1 bifunctional folylpolyglutamate synthase/dihydrofolate synthase [Bacillus canaveralius]PLR93254.1 bifunctional folylpolyglutamate synthase/dihydrofolate synthase [Bacillus canaveralius]RSK52454.1 bifunctional folylpolyglutamate synthase/dihydrofolate synthase [Bacillus canaveralius]
MFHTYDEALIWIHGRLRLGIKPGLTRMEWMMEKLDHPERRLKTIHIGGTNGKGSTVAYLRSILQEAGFKVGAFTSPYFEHFNERISVNGTPISNEDLLDAANAIFPLAEELEQSDLGGPTEFEVITAMSMYFFAKINVVDVVIYEVGLGGRFDSTNIIHPMLSVITSIGLDHTSILGDTREQIAAEKAGIIKKGTAVITAVSQDGPLKVIKQAAKQMKAPLYQLGAEFAITFHTSIAKGEQFTVHTLFKNLENVEIHMIGKHQTENAALAIMSAQILNHSFSFEIDESAVRAGLKKASWPGRFEIISENPLIVMDGAHNEEGVAALVRELKSRYSSRNKIILFAALKDKKLDRMLDHIDTAADRIVFTSFNFPRAATAEDLYNSSLSPKREIARDWQAFLEKTIPSLKDGEMLILTGSLYFLSQIKPYLKKLLKK